jgi:RimJ/RimL family protein N-acetyltransferase
MLRVDEPVRIEGTRVTLRPFGPQELEIWFAGTRTDDPRLQPGGPPPRERLQERVRRSGRFHGGWLDLAIDIDGRAIGQIGTYEPPGEPLPPGVFQFGIQLFEPGDRRRGHGSQAIALLTQWLFDHAGATRVEAGTADDNDAMQRVLERLGFHRAGTSEAGGIEFLLYALERPGSGGVR